MSCCPTFLVIFVAFSNLCGSVAVNITLNEFNKYASHYKPPLGLAFAQTSSKEVGTPVKHLCTATWPDAKQHGWFYSVKESHHLYELKDDIIDTSSADMGPAFSGFFHHTWCNTKEYPTLINGRKIVGINESTERGGGFYVAYKDDGNGDIKSIHHEESGNNELDTEDHLVLFYNVTALRSVQHMFRTKRLREVVPASYYDDLIYVDEKGKSIDSGDYVSKYVAVLCLHRDVKELCAAHVPEVNDFQNYSVCKTCKKGLVGHNCQIDINECEKGNEVKTYWYGTCYSRPGTEKDIKLEKIPVTHGGHKCSEHSKCVNNFGSYTCECNQGWTGKLCDKDLNECGINPCKNNGTCHNTPGSYSCTCTENFAGHDCGEVQLVKRFMRYDILFGGLGAFVFCLIGWFLLMARRKDAGGSTAKSVRESKRRKKVSLHTNQEAPSKKLKKSQSNHDYVVPNINL